MQPPPKPKGTPDDLAEVERALSVLKGRHPEHERVRREEEEAKARRLATIEAEARVAHRKVLARRARFFAVGVVGLAILAVVGVLFRREVVRRAHLEESSDPYRSMGFVVLETSSRGAGSLEASVDAGCLLGVSTDAAPIKVTRAAGSFEGPGPVLFCTCQTEHITLSSQVAGDGGLSLLRVDAAILGGSAAFAYAPFKPRTVSRTDETCGEASLDAWIDAKRFPAPQADESWLTADPGRAPFVLAKAKVIATLRSGSPFTVVDLPKESCLVATSDRSTDRLSLRVHGGAQPIPPTAGTIAWCASAPASTLFRREGDGVATAVVVPAATVGGLLGLRELTEKAGLHLAFATVPPTDHAWNARALLLSSLVPEALITTANAPEIPPAPEARVIALSFGTANALASESPADVFSYCAPPVTEQTRESLCIFSGEQTWRIASPDAIGGLARAKMPFWLFGLGTASDPVALKAGGDLATLARRLEHDGFEPTTIEAMTELPNGVEVLGRSAEDAIVAVGVMPAEPWIVPYSDGPVWSLTGEPRVVPLEPLAKATLTTAVKLRVPKDKRRTVVFRRHKR